MSAPRPNGDPRARTLPYWHVDVFSPVPFGGNSLTVFPAAAGLTAEQMRRVAQEMRHFESIFLAPSRTGAAGDATAARAHGVGTHEVRARVFDLDGELDFAGHPVLGAACVLHAALAADLQAPGRERPGAERARAGGTASRGHAADADRETRARRWTFALNARAVHVDTEPVAPATHRAVFRAVLDQGRPTFLGTIAPERAVDFAAALGLAAEDLHPALPLDVVSTGLRYLVVPLAGTHALARARIARRDFAALLGSVGAEFVYVLDVSDPAAPEARHWNNDGVVEDVATGSGAGCAGAYLARHGVARVDQEVVLRQGRFTGRPSEIRLRAEGRRDDVTRVLVGGDVAFVGRGTLEAVPLDATGSDPAWRAPRAPTAEEPA